MCTPDKLTAKLDTITVMNNKTIKIMQPDCSDILIPNSNNDEMVASKRRGSNISDSALKRCTHQGFSVAEKL